jgi:hypothetical protein
MAFMTEPLLPSLTQGPSPFDAAEALASGLASTLRLARVMAETGRPVDFCGLDEQVGLLCAKALDLPPDQGRSLNKALTALLEDTEALHRALVRYAVPPDDD